MTELCFYFDESVDLSVSQQLSLAGLITVSAHSLGTLGDTDPEHLKRATDMGYVLCTCDTDFLILASDGMSHAGIVYGAMNNYSVGDWIRFIRRLYTIKTPEQVTNMVFFVER